MAAALLQPARLLACRKNSGGSRYSDTQVGQCDGKEGMERLVLGARVASSRKSVDAKASHRKQTEWEGWGLDR